jgi:ssDNA-binding Zn-finger/Zn-ribbon topoisomerase 1
MKPIICPECGAEMVLRGSRFGLFYGCERYPDCKAAHGAHANGKPLGVPANEETKKARIAAHNAFDQLWKSGKMKRKDAYKWLSKALEMKIEKCHIGAFDAETCERVIKLANEVMI